MRPDAIANYVIEQVERGLLAERTIDDRRKSGLFWQNAQCRQGVEMVVSADQRCR